MMGSLLSDLVQYRKLFLMIFVLGIGGTFSYGFQVSMISYPSMYIKNFINDTWQERYHSVIDEQTLTLLWSFIVSTFSIGGFLGSISSGYLSAKYGKKKCLTFNNLLLIAAAFFWGFSKIAKSFEMILIGRFLCGLYTGLSCCLHGQYLAEISPKKLRGFTTATLSLFVNMGKCLGQIAGLSELLGTESLWPLLMAIGGITALVQLVTLPFFPESPPYLLMQKGDMEGCQEALKHLWGEGNHQGAIDDMVKEQATMKKIKPMNVLELLKDRSLRCQLCLLIIIGVTLQLNGINAIYFYAFDVFHTAGFTQDRIPYITLGTGTCEFCAAIMCSLIIDKFGRRMLLLWGYGLMALILVLLTTALSLQHQFFWMPYCSVALIFLFIIIFATGPAGASFPIMVELFTQSSRSSALVISTSLHWVGLYVIGMIFPYVVESLGTFSFLIFVGFISIAWILIYRFLPETKGKSVMEIKEEFSNLNVKKKCAQAMGENPSDKCTKL
ncbi:solute carrier family 2, facilitated glucose transporter member 11-like isoform X1 [Mauremys reevesii]|uniref:solute carrier family 2, facilitated glucose transporter member 11-like isoform X1 n=1 Tax=Mauremys reevesii TaxID=260615 RepID=UPI00193FE3C6|nr:solute carrier family 2, facilitated glucose transporter member 11-like isoform X1 [Mauremys reevesii]